MPLKPRSRVGRLTHINKAAVQTASVDVHNVAGHLDRRSEANTAATTLIHGHAAQVLQGASSPAPAAPSPADLIRSAQALCSSARAARARAHTPNACRIVSLPRPTPRTAAPIPRSRAEAQEPNRRAPHLKEPPGAPRGSARARAKFQALGPAVPTCPENPGRPGLTCPTRASAATGRPGSTRPASSARCSHVNEVKNGDPAAEKAEIHRNRGANRLGCACTREGARGGRPKTKCRTTAAYFEMVPQIASRRRPTRPERDLRGSDPTRPDPRAPARGSTRPTSKRHGSKSLPSSTKP
jgi:hypothetical protein